MSKSLGNVVDPQRCRQALRGGCSPTLGRLDRLPQRHGRLGKDPQAGPGGVRQDPQYLPFPLKQPGGLYPLSISPLSRGRCPKGQRGLLEIDRWVLLRLNRLVQRTLKAYDEFEFHLVYHGLYDFCVNDLSAFYLDMSKDRYIAAGKTRPNVAPPSSPCMRYSQH